MLIQHISTTGRDEQISRPLEEAVPLFWRFMIEKYGVDPASKPGDLGTATSTVLTWIR